MGIDKPQVTEDAIPLRITSPNERWRAAMTTARLAGTPDEVRECLDALGLLDVRRPA